MLKATWTVPGLALPGKRLKRLRCAISVPRQLAVAAGDGEDAPGFGAAARGAACSCATGAVVCSAFGLSGRIGFFFSTSLGFGFGLGFTSGGGGFGASFGGGVRTAAASGSGGNSGILISGSGIATGSGSGGGGSTFLGRDHHPRAFTMWFAGGGIKPGVTVGRTDDLGYNIVEDPVSVHDLHATILHLMGIDHTKLTYRFQGRDFRLTDVAGEVVKKLLA